jgi:hypothetical protein
VTGVSFQDCATLLNGGNAAEQALLLASSKCKKNLFETSSASFRENKTGKQTSGKGCTQKLQNQTVN